MSALRTTAAGWARSVLSWRAVDDPRSGHERLAPVFAILAVGVAVADTIPYVRDILRGTTRPHRGTWFIWGILAIVVTLSQRSDGASWSVLVAAAQAGLTLAVFALSIRRGEGGLSSVDGVLFAIAACGVAGWAVAGEPIIATVCVIVADLVAATMVHAKDVSRPRLGNALHLRPGEPQRCARGLCRRPCRGRVALVSGLPLRRERVDRARHLRAATAPGGARYDATHCRGACSIVTKAPLSHSSRQ